MKSKHLLIKFECNFRIMNFDWYVNMDQLLRAQSSIERVYVFINSMKDDSSVFGLFKDNR